MSRWSHQPEKGDLNIGYNQGEHTRGTNPQHTGKIFQQESSNDQSHNVGQINDTKSENNALKLIICLIAIPIVIIGFFLVFNWLKKKFKVNSTQPRVKNTILQKPMDLLHISTSRKNDTNGTMYSIDVEEIDEREKKTSKRDPVPTYHKMFEPESNEVEFQRNAFPEHHTLDMSQLRYKNPQSGLFEEEKVDGDFHRMEQKFNFLGDDFSES
ncbi:unnamed protein product [Moneuplotes crassus]|uniref:Uncharacterized protein n=1 Tax=Euplotes crassus TaxID=5936 RepID=A0AAD1UMN9_EUPCR|nr:unnamed protein product [Moneuplotes crassus]